MTDLTQRQLEIFRLIYETARDKGYQPTVREMMGHCGFLSPQAIGNHVDALVRIGYLARLNGSGTHANRAWVILRRPDGSRFDGFAEKDESMADRIKALTDAIVEPRSADVGA